jgi:hypothetical protein
MVLVMVVVSPVFTFAYPVHSQTFFPTIGQFYYDGQLFAESYLCWGRPGGWSVSDPGYEHDLRVRRTFFSSCTSWTTLPDGYNDCPTAGTLEPDPNYYIFSFGSFHARRIQANINYYGAWNFAGNGTLPPPSDFSLHGQEVARLICPFDSPWCMEGTGQSYRLVLGTLTRGQTYWNCWSGGAQCG